MGTYEYKATTAGHLKVRIQSKHEGVKKLCNQCDYKAYDKPSLTKRVKAVHLNLKTHTCPLCDFKTSLVEYLAMHNKRVHAELKSTTEPLVDT